MPAEPAREPLESLLGIGRDRLVGDPVLKVQGQLPRRLVPLRRLEGHRLQADGLERRGDGGQELAGGRELSLLDLGDDLDRLQAGNGHVPVISS